MMVINQLINGGGPRKFRLTRDPAESTNTLQILPNRLPLRLCVGIAVIAPN